LSRNLGFDLSASSTKIVLDSQRVDFVQEFDVGFMPTKNALRYGVLFSGPNGNPLFLVLCLDCFLIGVGKSTIGLLSFLNQFAQSRPVVYIPYGRRWVDSSVDSTDRMRLSNARNYFLYQFFLQNADLIAATPSLYNIFRCFFDGIPPTFDVYPAFADALEASTIPQCGFIIDESQVNLYALFVCVVTE
jgi:hypothetical protein